MPVVLGWPDQGLAFDAVVHLGTALALLGYFARDLGTLAHDVLRGRALARRLAGALVLGSIPAGLAGLWLEDLVETVFRSARVVGLALVGGALLLWWADRRAARARIRAVDGVGPARALVVGGAQTLALVPGTSRSGVTIAAGLLAGLDRVTAARFAFLLGLPITAAAGLFKARGLLPGMMEPGAAEPGALALGLVAAFASGLLAVWFLLRYLQRRGLGVFVAYRIALGALVLWLA